MTFFSCLYYVLPQEQVLVVKTIDRMRRRMTCDSCHAACRMTMSSKFDISSVPNGPTRMPPSAVLLSLSTSSRKRPWQGMAPPLSMMSMYQFFSFSCCTVIGGGKRDFTSPLSACDNSRIFLMCIYCGFYLEHVVSSVYLCKMCILVCQRLQVLLEYRFIFLDSTVY